MNINIDVDTNSAIIRLKGMMTKSIDAIDRAAKRWIHLVNRDAKLDAADASGQLKNSIKVKQTGQASYESSPEVKHGQWVENGSKPGGAPKLADLLDWIKIRGIIPHNSNDTPIRLARAIRNKIATKGIKAQPYMQPSHDKNKDKLRPMLEQHLRGAL